MRRPLLALVLVLTLTGCSGMKDLFTAHADVAAEAAGHTLSADSLASLMLEAKGARLGPEMAEFLANLWVDYQLFGSAVVTGTLRTDSAAVEEILWPEITEAIGSRWHDTLIARRTSFGAGAVDSIYASTDSQAVRVLQHLLVRVAPTASVAERGAARTKAAGLLARARAGADLGALARQFSDDQASRPTGGVMNAAPRGAFVTPFDSAGWTLAPGQLSGIVTTPFGFHIIRRPPLAEVRSQLRDYLEFDAGRRIDSLYMDSLGQAKHLVIKDNAPATMRSAFTDPDGSRNSGKAIATFDGGKLDVREMLRWTGAMPPEMVSQLKSATDSQLVGFARALTQNILLISDARANGIGLTADEKVGARVTFLATLDTLRYTVGITADVTDTTATLADREAAASLSINTYLGKLLRREAPARAVPGPMTWYLRDRMPYRVNMTGVARAAEIALARRDSAQSGAPRGPALPTGPSAAPQVTPQGGRP